MHLLKASYITGGILSQKQVPVASTHWGCYFMQNPHPRGSGCAEYHDQVRHMHSTTSSQQNPSGEHGGAQRKDSPIAFPQHERPADSLCYVQGEEQAGPTRGISPCAQGGPPFPYQYGLCAPPSQMPPLGATAASTSPARVPDLS